MAQSQDHPTDDRFHLAGSDPQKQINFIYFVLKILFLVCAWGLRLLRLGRYGHRGTRMAVVKLRLVEKGHTGRKGGGGYAQQGSNASTIYACRQGAIS
jgi:hypothetical protein